MLKRAPSKKWKKSLSLLVVCATSHAKNLVLVKITDNCTTYVVRQLREATQLDERKWKIFLPDLISMQAIPFLLSNKRIC